MTYSDCDPDRPTTPESRLRDALEADVVPKKLRETNCESCKFWQWFGDEEGFEIGTCHRFPPVWIEDHAVSEHNKESKAPFSSYRWESPTTVNSNFCGEFAPNLPRPRIPQ